MNSLPAALIQSLHGVTGFVQEEFENVHASGEQVTSIRVNPMKWTTANGQWKMRNEQPETNDNIHFNAEASKVMPVGVNYVEPVPWCQYGFYLSHRPFFTFDPLFHAGCYYVQEASGMFLEQILKQTVDLSQPLKLLDLCAAPGGKSTHVQSLISPGSLLVSNEVIKSRNGILVDNTVKWGGNNVVVTQNDPKDFARLENYFDVILVDAPCSGSGLFRRNPQAIDEWSLKNVQLCCQRQQRILADVLPALKKGGVFIYSTCSYSKEENEDILDWLADDFSVESCRLTVDSSWGIVEVKSEKHEIFGYRFFPDKVKGEGFFISCFRRTDGDEWSDPKERSRIKNRQKPEALTKDEIALVKPWISKEDYFIKQDNSIIVVKEELAPDIHLLSKYFRVTCAGTMVGKLIREKMLPDHALAMSLWMPDQIKRLELNYDQAIRYLKKQDLMIKTDHKGWILVTFQHHPLGWINILPGRINNYYPKELRILKDVNEKHIQN